MNTKRLITLAVGCAVLALPVYVGAQDQQDQSQGSVADAARKAQAERKNAPKAKLTIDNDNLSTLTGQVNVIGEAPAADDQSKQPAADDKAAKAPAKDEGYWREKFSAAYKKLADDQHELDILQREYNLKQEQFYTDPMASLKQDYSRQDLNDQRAKIDDKKTAVDQDKASISSLEDDLRQAGGDAGWATPPAQGPQAASGQSSDSQPAPASAPGAPQP